MGIVLFEMFYRPLLPGMERITMLKALRNSSIFPSDFASEVPEVSFKAFIRRTHQVIINGKSGAHRGR